MSATINNKRRNENKLILSKTVDKGILYEIYLCQTLTKPDRKD